MNIVKGVFSNDFLFKAPTSKVKSFQNKAQLRAQLCQQKLANMRETGMHPGYLQRKQLTPPCASARSSSLCAAATLDRHKTNPRCRVPLSPCRLPPPLTKKNPSFTSFCTSTQLQLHSKQNVGEEDGPHFVS